MAYTIAELQDTYITNAQAQVQSIDISALSDFQAKSFGTGGVGAALSLDAERLFNEIYPQYATALGVNTQLAAAGVAAQLPSSPSFLTLYANNLVAGKSYNIPLGTFITAPNRQVYKVIASTSSDTQIVISSTSNRFYATSTTNGLSTNQSTNTVLTFTPPIVATDGSTTFNTCTVLSSVTGTDQESLSDATARLIQVKQVPLDNTRSTDYKDYVIRLNTGSVTDSVVLTNNQIKYLGSLFNCAIFLAGATKVTDEVLNKGLVTGTTPEVFTRTVNETVIESTQQNLVAQYIVGSRPKARTVVTQALTTNTNTLNPYIKCTVTLQSGYSLNSNITLGANVFTLKQLIQREIRRAVCGQEFGATLTQDILTGEITASKLLISAIQNQLDVALGTSSSTGTLGAYLVNRTIYIDTGGSGTYTQPSSLNLTLGIPTVYTGDLPWIYDISLDATLIYPNIGVEVA